MKNKKIGFIIQARNGSSRLPEKIIKKFHNGQSILDILLKKLKSNFSDYKIVLATSELKCDEKLKEYSTRYEIDFFQGDHNNVLNRFIDAAREYELSNIIRICSDNPFLISYYIADLIENFKENDYLDYISYKMSNGLPVIKSHLGLFVEVVSLSALKKAKEETDNKEYLGNVTQYIYENPDKFNVLLNDAPDIVFDKFNLRLTVDDYDDFKYLSDLYALLDPDLDNLNKLIRRIESNEVLMNYMRRNILKYQK